ncbi:MAG: CBS domain-containing protein, partial [Candidatus Omnitrophica bacterium]|nr:CBS domain-containing protein [Candidatus Omnitrophota bacterium]
MNKTHKKELPVVDSKNKVKGMISYYDILDMRTPSNLKAETIMTNVPLLRKEESIENALDLMISSGIEAMAVADSHSKIIGIVSEYDLIKYFLNEGMFSKKEIPEFIRTNIKPLSIDDNLLKAKRKMGFYNVPLLPVV